MGVHRGGEDVPYNLPIEADYELGEDMFGDLGYTPKMTDVFELITNSDNHDDNFKWMWLMLAGNTVIAPTTSNKVGPRWYGVLVYPGHIKHSYQLMYIEAIDLTGLDILLPAGEFPINVWSKEEISQLLSKDVQANGISFGRLPGLVTLDDAGISHVSHCLEANIGAVSTATRNVARPPPPRRTRQTDSAGKNVAEDSETESDFAGDVSDESDDSDDEDDDTGYHVVYHGKKRRSSSCTGAACEASGSRAVGVESSESGDVDVDVDNVEEDDANVEADDGVAAKSKPRLSVRVMNLSSSPGSCLPLHLTRPQAAQGMVCISSMA
ncbi:hypothetical protein D1007_05347 [Hordeum vulgare]|nr:hypothetical protein D1007_05347 [Hordeum vulgare]